VTVRDDPNTRLKTADARAVLEFVAGSSLDRMLMLLQERHQLKAITVIINPIGTRVTVGDDVSDAFTLEAWVKGAVERHPDPAMSRHISALLLAVRDDGVLETATWGATKAGCAVVAAWRDVIETEFSVCPFQTWFGWGNGGRPKRLRPEVYEKLSPGGQAYVNTFTHPDAVSDSHARL
jgi:hypothetical protein